MAEIFDLNVTDSSNTGRFPEGQAPSTVNNGARALEGMLARGFRDTIMPTKTSGGSANAQTLTTNQTISAYAAGTSSFVFKARYTNTGTCTMNVDSLGAKTIKNLDGTNLAAGAITAGGYYWIVYNGTNFILMNSSLAPYLSLAGGTVTNALNIVAGVDQFNQRDTDNNTGYRTITTWSRGDGSGAVMRLQLQGGGANNVTGARFTFSGVVPLRMDGVTGRVSVGTNGASGLDVCTIQQLFAAVAPKADIASPAFTGNPTAPTQATSNDSTRIATTEFVKDASFGWGQTWQDVSGSRSAATNYTNTTGKPIQVAITLANVTSEVRVGGVAVGSQVASGIGMRNTISFTVPPGGVYRLHSSVAFIHWSELR